MLKIKNKSNSDQYLENERIEKISPECFLKKLILIDEKIIFHYSIPIIFSSYFFNNERLNSIYKGVIASDLNYDYSFASIAFIQDIMDILYEEKNILNSLSIFKSKNLIEIFQYELELLQNISKKVPSLNFGNSSLDEYLKKYMDFNDNKGSS